MDGLLAQGDPKDYGVQSGRRQARTTVLRLLLRGELDPALAAATIRGILRDIHFREEVARWMPLESRALLAPLADTKDEAVLEAVAKALDSPHPPK